MKPEDELQKLKAESEYWFSRWQQLSADFFHAQFNLSNAENGWKEERAAAVSLQLRLNLAAEYYKEAAKTGYVSSWNICGVTEEGIKKEIKAAKSYISPIFDNAGKITFNRPSVSNKKEVLGYMEVLENHILRISK